MLRPTNPDEVCEIVRAHSALRPVAGRTKPALSAAGGRATPVDVSALAGVIEYQPQECTFTAHAATPVAVIDALLAQHGQYLPFDPPFMARGATLGGTVASGLSGPLRYQYGGVRDFLLGARFVDGEGRIVRSGGKVVKNAAGFYLHHLLIGSLGQLAILLDVTFKVFPRPEGRMTVVASYPGLAEALAALGALRRSAFELAAVDLLPRVQGHAALYVRLAGVADALAARAEALERYLEVEALRLDGANEEAFWRDACDLSWAPGESAVVKVPVTPGRIAALDEALAAHDAERRYGSGGDVAWIAWRAPLSVLDRALASLRLSGLVIIAAGTGEAPIGPHLGVRPNELFLERARQALDPQGRFLIPDS